MLLWNAKENRVNTHDIVARSEVHIVTWISHNRIACGHSNGMIVIHIISSGSVDTRVEKELKHHVSFQYIHVTLNDLTSLVRCHVSFHYLIHRKEYHI